MREARSTLGAGAGGELVAAALDHGLAEPLYANLRDADATGLLYEEASNTLRASYLRTSVENAARLDRLERLEQSLARAGVLHARIKGAALLGEVYDDPGLRPMSDVDLLVNRSDVLRAVRALAPLGYAPADPRELAFFHFGLVWILYIAVEPYARRLWPRMMISWMRLLDGRFRDPLVGRDVLMGCIMAAMFAFLVSLSAVVPVWLGHGPPRPDWGLAVEKELAPLGGIAHSVSTLFLVHSDTLKTALFLSVALLLLRFLLRRKWLAVGAFWFLWVLVFQSQGGTVLVDLLLTSALAALFLFFLFRFGWLSIAVGLFVNDVLLAFPLTFDPTAWYAGNTLFALVVVFGLAIYGFKVSLGDRPAFEDLLAEG